MGNITGIGMQGKYERDYVAKHQQIGEKLKKLTEESGGGCFEVAKIATALGMDQRTVRSHLKILEADHVGVFVNTEEKEFCTKEGVILLAKRLGLKEIAAEQKS